MVMLTQELIEAINEPEPGIVSTTADIVRELGVMQKLSYFHLNASRFRSLQRICSNSTRYGQLTIAVTKTGAAIYLLQLKNTTFASDNFAALRAAVELAGGGCWLDEDVLVITLQPGCVLEQLTDDNGSVFTVTSATNRL